MSKAKYGIIWGEELVWYRDVQGYASDVWSAKSGRLGVYDISNGAVTACDNDAAAFSCYVDIACTVTATGDWIPAAMNPDMFATEMPYAASGAAATLTEAVLEGTAAGSCVLSKLIDLYVASNIQYADNAASQAGLVCVGGDVAENTLYVKPLNSKLTQLA